MIVEPSILFVGDPHTDPVGPSSRLDNYGETCLLKMAWVMQTARELGVSAIVLAGDTNGEGMDSRSFRIRMKSVYKTAPCPVVTLVGNHLGDTVHSKFPSWPTRELGDYVISGCYSVLTDWSPIPGVRFLALNAYQYTPATLPEDDPANPVTHIFAHAFIDIADPELSFKTVDLKKRYPSLKAIFAGHDHQHYPVMMVEGVKLFRPGSLMRTSADVSSNRIPVVGHYNLVTKAYQEIPVAPAQPFEVVFSSAVKSLQKEAKDNLEAFKGTLQAMKAQGSNVVEKAWTLADSMGALEREIISEDLKTNGFVR